MTSESAYSTGSSYLNVAVPTQDIEDNLLMINADTIIPCETPRERLPVFDPVNMNEYQHPQHPQQSDNAMALMDNTGHGSAYALTRVMSPTANPNNPFSNFGANQSLLLGFETRCQACNQMTPLTHHCVQNVEYMDMRFASASSISKAIHFALNAFHRLQSSTQK